jgi:hypothetical protein
MSIVINDYEKYIKELFKLSPTIRFIYGKKDKDALSRITNYLDKEYKAKYKELIYKFKDTRDIELKLLIENEIFNIDNNLSYLLFSSYNNIIIEFNYSTNNIYPKNDVYKRLRQKDFDIFIKSMIEYAREGIKIKMTYPKIIIKKFINQIKSNYKYRNLHNFLKKEYLPHCRNEIGLCYIPNGKEIYKKLIKSYIGYIDMTPEEIFKIGMDAPKERIVITTTYKSRDELMNDCKKYNDHIYDNLYDKYFHYKPKKCIIQPIPTELEKTSPLGYYNDIEKRVFINLSYFSEISKAEIYTLIMHESFHFYHFHLMTDYYKLPKYKYYSYNNIALAEGFAHYMETYCEDYNDNNINSLIRKIRLVVDIGINYYGWTYKQSYDYFKKYIPDKDTDIKNEIERYICMPCQALTYYIGKYHIIKLRDDYLKKGGNIKDFHDLLLKDGLASFIKIDLNFE